MLWIECRKAPINMVLTQHNNFDKLIDNVYQTHCLLQQTAQKAVNHFLVIKNWITGFYIVERELDK